jgi:hypothetical protein
VDFAFKTNRVKLYLDSKGVPGWNEIDAVGLRESGGKTHWATSADASSTYADQGGGGRVIFIVPPLGPALAPIPPPVIPPPPAAAPIQPPAAQPAPPANAEEVRIKKLEQENKNLKEEVKRLQDKTKKEER